MDHLAPSLQIASLGSLGVLLAQPDAAHLALLGIAITSAGSVLTTSIKSWSDRKRADAQHASDKEEREFHRQEVKDAFEAASEQRARGEAKIVSKVETATDIALTSAQASIAAIDVANHVNQKLTRVTETLGGIVTAATAPANVPSTPETAGLLRRLKGALQPAPKRTATAAKKEQPKRKV